jgi:hypothetical protein
MENPTKIEAPAAPNLTGFPEKLRERWQDNYAEALRQAQVDHPGDDIQQRAVATREANRVFRVPELKSYRAAMDLEPWQVLHRKEDATQLKVVTIDGKKYSFPVPPPRVEKKEEN